MILFLPTRYQDSLQSNENKGDSEVKDTSQMIWHVLTRLVQGATGSPLSASWSQRVMDSRHRIVFDKPSPITGVEA